MSFAFAIFTSDPNLLRCELHRLDGQVVLTNGEHPTAMGLGSYAQDEVLMQRFPPSGLPNTLDELSPLPASSEALMFHASHLPVGVSVEENTQPFRSRRWFFCQTGALQGFSALRAGLIAQLPDYLRRAVRGRTDAEVAFALFLSQLREVGRTDDRSLEPLVAAAALGKTARRLQQASSEAGAARLSDLGFIATNQRILVAARLGTEPLHYTLLEGSDRCDLCGLPSANPRDEAALRAHRRRRTAVVANRISPSASGWIELPSGSAIGVDWTHGLQQVQF